MEKGGSNRCLHDEPQFGFRGDRGYMSGVIRRNLLGPWTAGVRRAKGFAKESETRLPRSLERNGGGNVSYRVS